jgi:hypothetical protein
MSPLSITISCADRPRPVYPGLEVVCNADGTLTIHADAQTAALLAGRRELGDVETKQAQLRDLIADAWYAADCPSAATGRERS